jgi:hypothetical protein
MTSKNKYEIRSQDMQEVLSTPPQFLTFWGTAIIVVLLFLGVLFLSTYKVAHTIKVSAQIIQMDGKSGLMIDSAEVVSVKAGQKFKLQVKNRNKNISIEGSITAIIDTTFELSKRKILVLAESSSNQLQEKLILNGTIIGDVEIQISEISLLHLLPKKSNQ